MRKASLAALLPAAALSVPASSARAGNTVVVFGDSLRSGDGSAAEQVSVAILEDRLEREGYGHGVGNASIAGKRGPAAIARVNVRALSARCADAV